MVLSMEKSDLLLALLYSPGRSGKSAEPIAGITRMTKLIYLLREEGHLDDTFKFVPYKMGPFSSEIYSEIDFLQNFPTPSKSLLLVEKDSPAEQINPEQFKFLNDMAGEDEGGLESDDVNAIYKLSSIGIKVAEQIWKTLPTDARELISKVKTTYGSLPLRKLLRYVYDNHPDMTINSEILDQVYG